jgi:hypothetical protein
MKCRRPTADPASNVPIVTAIVGVPLRSTGLRAFTLSYSQVRFPTQEAAIQYNNGVFNGLFISDFTFMGNPYERQIQSAPPKSSAPRPAAGSRSAEPVRAAATVVVTFLAHQANASVRASELDRSGSWPSALRCQLA